MKNLLLVLMIFLLNGCATIVQSGPDKIQVRTNPDGADVFLNGVPAGKTPMMLSIKRRDDCLIEIKKKGYETVIIDKGKVVAGWFLGNFILGGVLGLAIDLVAHNQGKYPEDPIIITLVAKE